MFPFIPLRCSIRNSKFIFFQLGPPVFWLPFYKFYNFKITWEVCGAHARLVRHITLICRSPFFHFFFSYLINMLAGNLLLYVLLVWWCSICRLHTAQIFTAITTLQIDDRLNAPKCQHSRESIAWKPFHCISL